MSECDYFEWIGARGCDRCGKLPAEHKGIQVLRRGAGPFGGDDDWESLTWAEYDERAARRPLAPSMQVLPEWFGHWEKVS